MIRKVIIAFIVVMVFAAVAVGDPVAYIEPYGFVITSDFTDIIMESAQVDIVYGTPGTLSGTFVMNNPTPNPISVSVAFPFELDMKSWSREKENTCDPNITFNGQNEPFVPFVGRDCPKEEFPLAWFTCKHSFSPGKTVVVVKGPNLPNNVSFQSGYYEEIDYCIMTAKNWSGKVGEEIVTVHFPAAIAKGQIIGVMPDCCTIDADCVRWDFKNFKPEGLEYDIHLQFLNPRAIAMVKNVSDEYKSRPSDSAVALKLARCLIALYGRQTSRRLDRDFTDSPERLSKTEYQRILSSIDSDADREKVAALYRKSSTGSGYEWNRRDISEDSFSFCNRNQAAIHIEITAILDAGLAWNDKLQPEIDEARSMLDELIRANPHDARVWNVYLANYWSFQYLCARKSRFASVYVSKPFAKAIDDAAENCPDDACIRLWKWYRGGAVWSDEKFKPVQAEIDKNGYAKSELPPPNVFPFELDNCIAR